MRTTLLRWLHLHNKCICFSLCQKTSFQDGIVKSNTGTLGKMETNLSTVFVEKGEEFVLFPVSH